MVEHQWGIRTKVRVALAGILILICTQIALTAYYLVEMSESSRIMSAQTRFVAAAEGLRRSTRTLVLPEPGSVTDDVQQRFLTTSHQLQFAAADTGKTFSNHAPELAAGVAHLGQAAKHAKTWFDLVYKARQSTSGQKEMDRLLSGRPKETGIDLAKSSESFTLAMQEVERTLELAVDNAGRELAEEQQYVTQVVDHANRNLISLTMLSLIYLALMFVMLPERLVGPIRRITRVIRQAELGRLDALAPSTGNNEIGRLADTFNATLTRLRQFDEKKKDRIVEDSAKLASLMRQLDWPAAILTTTYTIDHVNPALSDALGLRKEDADTPIHRFFAEGGPALKSLLDHVVRQRERVVDQPVRLSREGKADALFRATLDPCQDRQGRVSHIVLMLRGEELERSHP